MLNIKREMKQRMKPSRKDGFFFLFFFNRKNSFNYFSILISYSHSIDQVFAMATCILSLSFSLLVFVSVLPA